MANPNQALIDQLNAVVTALDDAEAQIDAGVKQYQDNLAAAKKAADDACAAAQAQVAAATTATNDAVNGLKAQKATYEAQEDALRKAITALGG